MNLESGQHTLAVEGVGVGWEGIVSVEGGRSLWGLSGLRGLRVFQKGGLEGLCVVVIRWCAGEKRRGDSR